MLSLVLVLVSGFSCDLLSGDQRMYCLALVQRNSGLCYSIQDSNLRTRCRAEVLRAPSICDGLPNDERQLCKARTKL